jgi:ATP-dependent helicase/nuclease subunit A
VGVPTAPAGESGAGVLEGYVDLLYRTPDGLVVVDHKTDAVTTSADIDEHMARYRVQGAAYAFAVERATGERVARCVFVFCTPNGPIEQPVTDLARAMDEVRDRIAAG